MPLLCKNCGLPLGGGDDAALFLCPGCGLGFEPGAEGLAPFTPLTAAVTSELAVSGPVQYLAVWRVTASVTSTTGSAWERISKVAAPDPANLYVPAFTLARAVFQRLGVSLTEAQPGLELSRGRPEGATHRPALVEVSAGVIPALGSRRGGEGASALPGPAFGTLSPVIVGRKDARILAHFVYLAVESHDTHELRSVDYQLHPVDEELVLIPAIWDPRYIHESNWRLLLREFDGLVA